MAFVPWLKERLVGAQIQDIWLYQKAIVLDCYRGESFSLIFELDPQGPGVFLTESLEFPQSSPKPVITFLRSHARGKRISDVEIHEPLDRIVHFFVGPLEIVFEAIPRSPNLHVTVETSEGVKKISWAKPIDRPNPGGVSEKTELQIEESFWSDWNQGWLQRYSGPIEGAEKSQVGMSSTAEDQRKAIGKTLKKKQDAHSALRIQAESDESQRWQKLGEELKMQFGQGTSFRDWNSLAEAQGLKLDFSLSLQENMKKSFEKAKQLEGKRAGTLERIRVLETEIAELERKLVEGSFSEVSKVRTAVAPKDRVNTRQLKLESGAVAWIGKTASDNLKLLRQARAWDYWLHLKDVPSAYVIIHRDKGLKISEAELRQVSVWLLSQSKLGKSGAGASSEVLVVECRHVKAIKGDKLGRATYQNPLRTLRVSID